MTNPSPIEQAVMKRVYRMHRLRRVTSPGALSAAFFVIALYAIGREVWVARVIENAPATVFKLPEFYLAAFLNTRIIVQLWSLVGLVTLAIAAREIARGLVHRVASLAH